LINANLLPVRPTHSIYPGMLVNMFSNSSFIEAFNFKESARQGSAKSSQ